MTTRPLIGIVDDETELVQDWATFLQADFEVLASDDPRNFHSQVRALPRKPDVIVTDLVMPQMSGQELINELLYDEVESEFVICSAYAQKRDAIAAINTGGIVGMLEKPIDPLQLVNFLHSIIDRRRRFDSEELELVETHRQYANLMERRVLLLEDFCHAQGVPLFKDVKGLFEYNNYVREQNRLLSRLVALSDPLREKLEKNAEVQAEERTNSFHERMCHALPDAIDMVKSFDAVEVNTQRIKVDLDKQSGVLIWVADGNGNGFQAGIAGRPQTLLRLFDEPANKEFTDSDTADLLGEVLNIAVGSSIRTQGFSSNPQISVPQIFDKGPQTPNMLEYEVSQVVIEDSAIFVFSTQVDS